MKGQKTMESASRHFSSTPKIERRVVEKNRRNHMKSLYSKLYSLLPNTPSKEAVPLPDQIDEVVKHIKSLEMKLEKSKEKKESLSGRKRSHSCTTESKPPRIEIRKMGSTLDVVLMTGEDDKFIFHEIIRLIYEEGAEILNASFSSVSGDSVFHSIHAKVGEIEPNSVAARVSNRLKEFVYESMSEVESVPAESWKFEIEPDTWELKIPQVLPMGFQNTLNPLGWN